MKAVILAGGMGTRLAEETAIRPKPMVEIGGKPILWHIMNIYAAHGVDEFIIALGYRGEVIKEYFLNFYAINNDISVDLATGTTTIHHGKQPHWKVHLVDTGVNTMTGGRLGRIRPWLGEDQTFMATYGDGVADVDIAQLLKFHQAHGRTATMTLVRPPSRFGGVLTEGDRVSEFSEKPQTGEGWINGGFFVLQREALDTVAGDDTIWERGPLESLSEAGQLMGYRHDGFWQPMDTLREKHLLEDLWQTGQAPWRVW
ncbi:glucose-1-phosphate cytidylyltransferase [Deinococcus metalli]|uniref:Glucose-1-phosphate cytidylyltransferase n=1 Tax=Deinococcus metalli TaxID=1141878 RepID=A0A7W8KEY2_9DEIO|nr:glucose-1-phosphate cytidylyltransferase [Deinococcus metalli]MBB5375781.1 glucose-1-phosphate cytidylyltransferase [Deinococcus metalli]GHF37096.1 glucose-1-phosphate cytidylyltransferase [Deinococcus metalli]